METNQRFDTDFKDMKGFYALQGYVRDADRFYLVLS